MANRFPLVVDSSALQIKEIPNGDNLDLTGNSIVNVVDITASGNVTIGGTLTYEDVQNIDSLGIVTARTGMKVLAGGINAVGVVTATTFSGSGANLTNLPSGQLTGALPAIDGSALTGVISGVGINTAGGNVGFGVTLFDFRGAGISTITAPVSGIATINITGGGGGGSGISTEAATPSNAVATLDLNSAQDHKLNVTGIVTVTCSGGVEGDSHTVRIINSGISTVGFSTFFLFPSGSSPTLPTASGAISLISFTVNRVGAAGTQLLAGSSLNFS
tara:strand:- start:86 stop:910 length:825 start_codon:yes stop_codon:yes gene_type:complete